MDPDTSEREIPKWLYKLFTGHAYPYVRRQAKFAKAVTPGEDRPEPTPNEIKAKFWEVYPQCRLKVLQEIKTGMIFFFQAEDGIRDLIVTGVQTCALPI